MRNKGASADLQISRIAGRQHGIVSIGQLLGTGLSRESVSRRVHLGRLHRVHRGVYSIGHAPISPDGVWMAAALACGDGAVVSHWSAAAIWGMLDKPNGPVDVAVSGYGGRKRRRGIRLHRCSPLLQDQVTRRRGIPVTNPARTISDLRRIASDRELRRAIRQADVLGLLLGEDIRPDRTRSDLERDFLLTCRRHRLPLPEVNVRIGGYEVDFLWRDCRLAVETDGYRYHRGRQAHRDDRRRDLELRARGFEVLRLSEEQVDEEPERVAEVLREVLASARHRVEPDGRDEDRDA
jgi:very-short-patch-repair endonuclease